MLLLTITMEGGRREEGGLLCAATVTQTDRQIDRQTQIVSGRRRRATSAKRCCRLILRPGRYLDWGVSQKLNIPGAVRDWGEFQPCYFKEEGRLRLLLLRLRLVRRCIHITRPKSRVDALVSLNFEARQG